MKGSPKTHFIVGGAVFTGANVAIAIVFSGPLIIALIFPFNFLVVLSILMVFAVLILSPLLTFIATSLLMLFTTLATVFAVFLLVLIVVATFTSAVMVVGNTLVWGITISVLLGLIPSVGSVLSEVGFTLTIKVVNIEIMLLNFFIKTALSLVGINNSLDLLQKVLQVVRTVMNTLISGLLRIVTFDSKNTIIQERSKNAEDVRRRTGVWLKTRLSAMCTQRHAVVTSLNFYGKMKDSNNYHQAARQAFDMMDKNEKSRSAYTTNMGKPLKDLTDTVKNIRAKAKEETKRARELRAELRSLTSANAETTQQKYAIWLSNAMASIVVIPTRILVNAEFLVSIMLDRLPARLIFYFVDFMYYKGLTNGAVKPAVTDAAASVFKEKHASALNGVKRMTSEISIFADRMIQELEIDPQNPVYTYKDENGQTVNISLQCNIDKEEEAAAKEYLSINKPTKSVNST